MTADESARLLTVVDALIPVASRFLDILAESTKDDVIGITRASYGPGEQVAADLLAGTSRDLGLTPTTDHAGNVLIRQPGRASDDGGVFTGSHLDSVPSGGNFDGAAGAIAGVIALAALEQVGLRGSLPVTAVGFRGEESAWFSVHHIGSRAALGLLPSRELDEARRFDTGRSLGLHMAEAGCDLDALRAGRRSIDPAQARAFVELHIEQGPVLVHEAVPIGIVTGIRGNARVRGARCIGEYAHSGAVPRGMRRDAVMASAALVHQAEAEWRAIEAEGGDLVLTFGKFGTDPALHGHNKVPGEVAFVVDARSHERATLDRVEMFLTNATRRIAAERGVAFELGPVSRVSPAPMNAEVQAVMREGAAAWSLQAIQLASGGGHDAGDFANSGVPTGMIFVRNPNGSHNPDEAMSIEDFACGVRLLAWTLARLTR